MSGEQQVSDAPRGGPMDVVGGVIGIIVFLAGIAMIVLVFTSVRGVFDGVDAQVQQARLSQARAAARAAEAEAAAEAGSEEQSGEVEDGEGAPGASAAVVAEPYDGPTIADVGITIGLKMLGLLVLGWLGALVASRGAQFAGAHRGKRE